MKPTYPINYRGGWMQPVAEYVPKSGNQGRLGNQTVNYPIMDPSLTKPLVRDNPSKIAQNHTKKYNTANLSTATPVTEFVNEPHVFDPIESNEKQSSPAQSSLREPLHFHDTYDNQDITEREWRKEAQGITNISNLGNFVDQLWNDVQKAKSTLNQSSDEDIISYCNPN